MEHSVLGREAGFARRPAVGDVCRVLISVNRPRVLQDVRCGALSASARCWRTWRGGGKSPRLTAAGKRRAVTWADSMERMCSKAGSLLRFCPGATNLATAAGFAGFLVKRCVPL